MTTTASAKAPSSMTWWPKAVPPSPCTAIRIGSVSTVSLGTVTTEAFSKERVRLGGDPVHRGAGLAEPRVVAADGLDGDALGGVDVDLHAVAGGDGGAVVQARAGAPAG